MSAPGSIRMTRGGTAPGVIVRSTIRAGTTADRAEIFGIPEVPAGTPEARAGAVPARMTALIGTAGRAMLPGRPVGLTGRTGTTDRVMPTGLTGRITDRAMPAVPTGRTTGRAMPAVPNGRTTGRAMPAVPNGRTAGRAMPAVPNGRTTDRAMPAVPNGLISRKPVRVLRGTGNRATSAGRSVKGTKRVKS